MKRNRFCYVLLMFSLLLLFVCAGCSEGNEGGSKTGQKAPSIESTEEPAVIPTEEPAVTPTEEPGVTPTMEPTVTTIVTEEVVHNNGGNFVKVGDEVYYIKVPENAFPQNALLGEFRSQIRPGQECALMCYRPDGEVREVARVLGHSKIAYYDSRFYVCGKGEDDRDRIWEVERAGGQKKLVTNATMRDIDPQTGRYVAYQESENERVLTVYEGDREAYTIALPAAEDSCIAYVCARGDYLIYWDASHEPVAANESWGKLYACHMPDNTTKCLGEIPYSLDWGAAYSPEMGQLVVRAGQVFFTIDYYGGELHFLEQSSVFQGDLDREESIAYLCREEIDNDYVYYGHFHENSLPDIVMTNLQDHTIYLDYDTYALCWSRPVPGALPESVALLARGEFETGSPNYQMAEVAEYVDGRVYCIINHVTENPEKSEGWKTAYTANRVEFCAINTESLEYTLLESQAFEG